MDIIMLALDGKEPDRVPFDIGGRKHFYRNNIEFILLQ